MLLSEKSFQQKIHRFSFHSQKSHRRLLDWSSQIMHASLNGINEPPEIKLDILPKFLLFMFVVYTAIIINHPTHVGDRD